MRVWEKMFAACGESSFVSMLKLDLTSRVRARLERIKILVGAKDLVDLARRAFATYDVLVMSVKVDGAQILIRYPDGKVEEFDIDSVN